MVPERLISFVKDIGGIIVGEYVRRHIFMGLDIDSYSSMNVVPHKRESLGSIIDSLKDNNLYVSTVKVYDSYVSILVQDNKDFFNMKNFLYIHIYEDISSINFCFADIDNLIYNPFNETYQVHCPNNVEICLSDLIEKIWCKTYDFTFPLCHELSKDEATVLEKDGFTITSRNKKKSTDKGNASFDSYVRHFQIGLSEDVEFDRDYLGFPRINEDYQDKNVEMIPSKDKCNTTSQSSKPHEGPCRKCGRTVDIGSTECWWCCAENPF